MGVVYLIVFICVIAFKLVSAWLARESGAASGLCANCSNAFVITGSGGEKRISCNYGGSPKKVAFAVTECTGFYCKVAIVTANKIGFVHEEPRVESFPETVIEIAAKAKG